MLPGVNVLGGVTLKLLAPEVHVAITNHFSANVPTGSITTFYRLQIGGTILYSRQYKRVKKRNSYTISYRDANGIKKYAFIDFFVYLHNKIACVLIPLQAMPITCKEHFKLTTGCLDDIGHLIPVQIQNSVCLCFSEEILAKCLFVSFQSVHYVLEFPSVLFD